MILAARQYLHGEEVLAALVTFDAGRLPLILSLTAAYLALKGLRFVVLMRPVTRLRDSVVFRAFVAGQAAALLPGGVAARAGMLAQAGEALGHTVAPVALSSILDQVIFLLGAGLAAFDWPAARVPAALVVGAALAVGGLLLVGGVRHALDRFLGHAANRLALTGPWSDFRGSLPRILTWPRLALALALTAVPFFLRVVTLALCLDGVGFSQPYALLFLAYTLPTMLGRLAPMPGGVGVTEAGMVGFLVAVSGMPADAAAAAVAVFRVTTVFFEALLGAIVYFLAWRGEGERPSSGRRQPRASRWKVTSRGRENFPGPPRRRTFGSESSP